METKSTLGRREFLEKATPVPATVPIGCACMKPALARVATPGLSGLHTIE